VKLQRQRKKPLRSCVSCRSTTDKRTLIRFVRTAEGEVACDPTGKRAGRGAYLCDDPQCFGRARKGHALDRALRTKLGETDYERLENDYIAACALRDGHGGLSASVERDGQASKDGRLREEDMV
jgi:predicted RNA-binding protein YlxR (DUF448 family)